MRNLFGGAVLAVLLACSACSSGPPPKIAGFEYVTPGKFKMGYANGRDNEKPEREVVVEKGFYIGTFEVTNKDYAEFLTAKKRAAPTHWVDGKYKEGESPQPVIRVSWDDAKAYAEWKDARLPTEIEWEYAARGSDGRLYPWGNDFVPGKCNNFGAGKNGPVDVGMFRDGKSPAGTYDQAGNVWEWTSTIGPGPNEFITRGGSYAPLEDLPRSSLRSSVSRDKAKETLGFRLAKDG